MVENPHYLLYKWKLLLADKKPYMINAFSLLPAPQDRPLLLDVPRLSSPKTRVTSNVSRSTANLAPDCSCSVHMILQINRSLKCCQLSSMYLMEHHSNRGVQVCCRGWQNVFSANMKTVSCGQCWGNLYCSHVLFNCKNYSSHCKWLGGRVWMSYRKSIAWR